LRELREETGYEGTQAEVIGQIYANPAIMNNLCYTVLVRGCELKYETEFDQGEDLGDAVDRYKRNSRSGAERENRTFISRGGPFTTSIFGAGR
jgi:8-oxo-dGTP pyrophosphatase MutT (NUDIX family)